MPSGDAGCWPALWGRQSHDRSLPPFQTAVQSRAVFQFDLKCGFHRARSARDTRILRSHKGVATGHYKPIRSRVVVHLYAPVARALSGEQESRISRCLPCAVLHSPSLNGGLSICLTLTDQSVRMVGAIPRLKRRRLNRNRPEIYLTRAGRAGTHAASRASEDYIRQLPSDHAAKAVGPRWIVTGFGMGIRNSLIAHHFTIYCKRRRNLEITHFALVVI